MFQGAWAIKAPGTFNKIPAKYKAFAAYKLAEHWAIGGVSLVFGIASACLVAASRNIAIADALVACSRIQGPTTLIALAFLLLAKPGQPKPKRK